MDTAVDVCGSASLTILDEQVILVEKKVMMMLCAVES